MRLKPKEPETFQLLCLMCLSLCGAQGFTEGTLLVGPHAGARVQDAKPLIRKELVETGQAILYSEPEKKVVSRSGDECVVALTDQW